jgi:hypothetical protein
MKIIVRISPDGKTQIEVDGMKGESCTDVTKKLEEALGQTVDTELKNEYYEQEETETESQGLGF